MLSQTGRGAEPNLGIGENPVRLAKVAHGYASERVLEVCHEKRPQRGIGSDKFAASFLQLYTVEHRFGVACTRQRGPRADNGQNVADGIAALRVSIRRGRAKVVGTVDKDEL